MSKFHRGEPAIFCRRSCSLQLLDVGLSRCRAVKGLLKYRKGWRQRMAAFFLIFPPLPLSPSFALSYFILLAPSPIRLFHAAPSLFYDLLPCCGGIRFSFSDIFRLNRNAREARCTGIYTPTHFSAWTHGRLANFTSPFLNSRLC